MGRHGYALLHRCHVAQIKGWMTVLYVFYYSSSVNTSLEHVHETQMDMAPTPPIHTDDNLTIKSIYPIRRLQ